MVTRTDFERAVRGEPDPVRRLMVAAGLISTAADAAGVRPLVLSGGTAVALLTHAAFATADIDFITPRGDALGDVLEALGFVRRRPHQHLWVSEATGVTVESPASELPPHSDVETVVGPDGHRVAIWSVTDLIVDRIAQAAGQGGEERLMQALALRAVSGTGFDARRARVRAQDDLVEREFDAFEDVVAAFATRQLTKEQAVALFRDGSR
jgi:hypothetical protein